MATESGLISMYRLAMSAFLHMEHVGPRVAATRKEARLNQEVLSETLEFKDWQTLSTIESGKRALRPDELVTLMGATGKELDYFVDPYRLVGEGSFSFRAENADPELLASFEEQAGRWLALYRRLSRLEVDEKSAMSPYTLTLKLSQESSFEDAESAAEWLQREWALGTIPTQNLISTAVEKLHLLVLFVDAPQGVSGAACRLKDLDTVIINRQDVSGRRMFDFAHELFHILTWDRLPPERLDVKKPKASKAKRVEQLANAFASRLLFPRKELERVWKERNPDLPLEQSLLEIAQYFGSSSQALYWRLVSDGFLAKDAVADFKKLPEPTDDETAIPIAYSDDFIHKLHGGLDRGLISARKASKVMNLTFEEMGTLFDERGLPRPYEL